MKRLALLGLLALPLLGLAHAETNTAADGVLEQATASQETPAQFKKILANIRGTRRAIASNQYRESDLTPNFIAFRQKFLAVTTADQLGQLLNEANANFDKFDAPTQYFVAQILPLRSMRGILWRARPIFEHEKNSSAAAHSGVVSSLRDLAAGLEAYLPTAQWRAGFAFISEPSTSMSHTDQFASMAAFQDFVAQSFTSDLALAAKRINTLLQKSTPNTVFVWDNQLNFGTGSFDDGIERYTGHGQAEIRATYASLLYAGHDVFVWASFNQDAMPKVIGEIGSLYGIDGFISGRDLGVNAMDRVAAVKSFKNSGYLSLRQDHAKDYLSKAWSCLSAATREANNSFELLQKSNPSASHALNPILFQPTSSPYLGKGLRNFTALVNGEKNIRSGITGEEIQVNLHAFYTNPPASLLDLLPTAFEQSGAAESNITNAKGETLRYRNYFHGRPIAWNNDAWSVYIPSAKGQAAGYMGKANRTLRYSLGTNIFWAPVSSFLF